MTARLSNTVALVTGGGGGIGRAICKAFAAQGAAVGVMDFRAASAESVRAEIVAEGGRAIAIAGNVAVRSEMFAAAAQLRGECGTITTLVNNAMWNRYSPLLDQDEQTIDRMIDVGLKGVIWGYQAAVPQMRDAGQGAIINIASISAMLAMKNGIMYSAVKGAVVAATRSAAAEFGPFNIRVNAIAPGPTQTDGANLVVNEEAWERRRARVPLGRLGQPEDVASAALFLASSEASFISGDVLFVDGAIAYAFS